jgi:hypothetical protein
MSVISGTRSTNSEVAGKRKYDTSDKLWMVDPDFAIMAFFSRKVLKSKTSDPEYRWFEKTSPSRYDAVNYASNYTAGAVEIIVDDGTKFRGADVVMDVSTGEQMRVSSVSSNTLTVVRGWGTTAATTITDNDVLLILGNANAEGASVRAALTNQSVKKENYTQIFREPIDVTGTNDATEYYAGANDLATLRKEHLNVHMRDIERSFFFGEKKEDTATAATPIRATGGARNAITTNVLTQTDLTNPEFEGWVRDLFKQGGDKKMGFLSPLIASAVSSWANGKLQMFPKDKTYGIAITEYLSIHGTLNFVVEKLFAENTTWNGYAFGFDMANLGYRYLSGNGQNRDTRLLKNRQAPGDDKLIEEYLSEVGFQLALEDRHGYIKGVQSYS